MMEWYTYVEHCRFIGWLEGILWHDTNNLAIFLAYAAISAMIAYVRKERHLPLDRMSLCFATFIFSCGLGHLMALGSMHAGWYVAQEVVNSITAIASVGTAIYLWKLMPSILSLPLPSEYRAIKNKLAVYEEDALLVALQTMRFEHDS